MCSWECRTRTRSRKCGIWLTQRRMRLFMNGFFLVLRLAPPVSCARFSSLSGLRAAMKAGYACMNDLTVIQASQGLCVHLTEVCKGNNFSVVVGYDARHNSRRYALRTATSFLLRGVRVYLFGGVLAGQVTDCRYLLHPVCAVRRDKAWLRGRRDGYCVA